MCVELILIAAFHLSSNSIVFSRRRHISQHSYVWTNEQASTEQSSTQAQQQAPLPLWQWIICNQQQLSTIFQTQLARKWSNIELNWPSTLNLVRAIHHFLSSSSSMYISRSFTNCYSEISVGHADRISHAFHYFISSVELRRTYSIIGFSHKSYIRNVLEQI